mmetsp:Transcript_46086/g.116666  ORF Transcript_46086/g.116666 Transcript_46086/m.116666 type:complete len:408 (-) Transcript_46086:762-1985(-)
MHVVERGDHEGDGICRNKVSDSSSTVERLPPPLVVLIAQLQVGGNHRHLSRDHACENSGKEDKSKKVVEVSLPHGRHGEVKHDENVAEDQETAAQGEDNAGDLLARHLPRDLVGADRVGADRLLGGNVAAKQAQRDGHQPPQAQDHEVGLQGDGPNSASLVQHDVQDGEHEHGDAREVERSTHRCSRPPSVALGNHAIDVHCAVSGHAGQQDVHADARAEQSPTRGGRKESQRRKQDGHQRAQQDLDACADLHAEMHGRGGRAEHVAHDQLPAKLLLKLRFCVAHNLLVLHEVTPDRAQQDDHHHARQHECHDQGVDDGEPVHLATGHLEVCVPAGGPLGLRHLPDNVVCVRDGGPLLNLQTSALDDATLHGIHANHACAGAAAGRGTVAACPDLKSHHGVICLANA